MTADLTDLGFRGAPVALMLLSERRIERVNLAFEALFGWEEQELSGRSVRLLYPSLADFAVIGRRWQQRLADGAAHHDERFMQLKTGEMVWMRAGGRSLTPAAPFRLTVWSFELLGGAGPEVLSPRERAVAQHVVNGRTSKEAALALGLSPRTVEVHRAAILRKLGVKSTAEMVARLIAPGTAGRD